MLVLICVHDRLHGLTSVAWLANSRKDLDARCETKVLIPPNATTMKKMFFGFIALPHPKIVSDEQVACPHEKSLSISSLRNAFTWSHIRITAVLGRVDNSGGFEGCVLMVVTILHYFIPLH